MSQRPQQYKESHVADTEDPPRSSMRPISILHRHFRPTQNDDEEELDDAISSTDSILRSDEQYYSGNQHLVDDDISPFEILPSTSGNHHSTETSLHIQAPTQFNASSSPPEIDEDDAATPNNPIPAHNASSSILRNSYMFITPSKPPKRPRDREPPPMHDGPSTTPIEWAKGIKMPRRDKIDGGADATSNSLSPKASRRKDRPANGYAQRFARVYADAKSEHAVWQHQIEQGKQMAAVSLQVLQQVERSQHQQTCLCKCRLMKGLDEVALSAGDEIMVLFTKGHFPQLHLACRKGDTIDVWKPWSEVDVHGQRCLVVSRARAI